MFDLDDTIVPAGSSVSDRVFAAIRAASAQGIVCAIASGRPLCMIPADITGSGALTYAVCSNGSAVWSLADGVRISHRPLSREHALACHDMLASLQPSWNAFIGSCAYFEWGGVSYLLRGAIGDNARQVRSGSGATSGPIRRVARLGRRGLRFLRRLLPGSRNRQVLHVRSSLARASAGVDKMGCSFGSERAASAAQSLLEADGRFEVARVSAAELEITAAGVTKATGAQILAERLGIARDGCVAFGNGANDLPLIEVVGRFVAVANADACVREVATDICPSVMDDGVAVWIESELARVG